MNQQLIDEIMSNKNYVYEKHELVKKNINEQVLNHIDFIDNRLNKFNVILDQTDLSCELDNTLNAINDFYVRLKQHYETIENSINSGNYAIQDSIKRIKSLITHSIIKQYYKHLLRYFLNSSSHA